ncbi:MAG TPA: CBS domain-containing protein [Planctomycetota bacterium]|nr:CBS domain-containing protein [Planctomycetota bacterium]
MIKNVLARDLMRGPVRQLTTWTPVRDAAAFLQRHGISGAPVIDEHGRWVGVFTQNDIARFVEERIRPATTGRTLESREEVAGSIPALPDQFGETPVQELMTLGMYTVFPDATLDEVVHALTAFKVHRVFVIRETGTAILGVITTMDILRWMERHPIQKEKSRRLARA